MASCRKGPQPETGVACTAERSKIAPWPSFLSWLMEGFALYGASIYSMEAYHHADLEADSLTVVQMGEGPGSPRQSTHAISCTSLNVRETEEHVTFVTGAIFAEICR